MKLSPASTTSSSRTSPSPAAERLCHLPAVRVVRRQWRRGVTTQVDRRRQDVLRPRVVKTFTPYDAHVPDPVALSARDRGDFTDADTAERCGPGLWLAGRPASPATPSSAATPRCARRPIRRHLMNRVHRLRPDEAGNRSLHRHHIRLGRAGTGSASRASTSSSKRRHGQRNVAQADQ